MNFSEEQNHEIIEFVRSPHACKPIKKAFSCSGRLLSISLRETSEFSRHETIVFRPWFLLLQGDSFESVTFVAAHAQGVWGF